MTICHWHLQSGVSSKYWSSTNAISENHMLIQPFHDLSIIPQFPHVFQTNSLLLFLLVPAYPGCPGQKPLNSCVCVFQTNSLSAYRESKPHKRSMPKSLGYGLLHTDKTRDTFPLRNDTTTRKFVEDQRDVVYLLKSTNCRHAQFTWQRPAASQHLDQPPTQHMDSSYQRTTNSLHQLWLSR